MSNILTARRVLVATLVCAAACSRLRGRPGAAAPAAPAASAASRTAPMPNAPSDANIAAILLAANNTDISYARLAPSRAQSQQVKDFAQQMLTDHTAVNEAVMNLLNRINLNPQDNVTSLDFRDESANRRDILRELEGRAFDTTYMSNEVSYHTKLLAAIDNVLLPAARDPQLKQTISSIRPAVASHLTHAQRVRAALTGMH